MTSLLTSPVEGAPSRVDFTEINPYPPSASSAPLQLKGVRIEHFHLPAAAVSYPALSEHFVLMLTGRPINLRQRVNGCTNERRVMKGSVTVLPAGHPADWRWDDCEVLHVRFCPEFFQRIAAEITEVNPDGVELLNHFDVHDPEIEHFGRALLAEIRQRGFASRFYAESLTNALAVHLLRRYSTLKLAAHPYKGGLPRHKLTRVTQFINDNLENDLTLTEIAAAVGMNHFHLTRGFKQTIGVSLHQYIILRRIERAKHLLTATTLPIVEVCQAAGFPNQSHFTAIFHRHTGTTPKRYRDER